MRWFRSIVAVLLFLSVTAPLVAQPKTHQREWAIRADGTVCGPYPTRLSSQGLTFIKKHEGFKDTAYHDSTGYAIGYGFHKWQDTPVTRSYPKHVTLQEADDEFARQLFKFETVVKDALCVELTQPQYDSLVSVAYNLGRVNTEIIRKMEAGLSVKLRDFLTTATVRNRPSAFLRIRRTQEFALFNGPSPIPCRNGGC